MVEKQWKYTRWISSAKLGDDEWYKQWNDMGQEGWELVSVINDGTNLYGYFKMEREPEEEEIAENLIVKGLNLMD